MKNKKEFATRIKELDELFLKENSFIELSIYGGGADESKVVGNVEGYAALGLAFLKAPFLNNNDKFSEQLDFELEKIITEDSEIQFSWFELTDKKRKPITYKETTYDKIITYSIFGVLVSMVVFAIIGLIVSIKWLLNL